MIVRCLSRAMIVIALAAVSACGAWPFGARYEYEEQMYLSVDGQATVVIDASLAALVALRGMAIDPSKFASIGRDEIRRLLEAGGCLVDSVSRPWTRSGRRFVQFQIAMADVRQPQSCGVLAWSSYSLTPIDPDGLEFQQIVGPPPQNASAPPAAWDGTELVAFKLHGPSRIRDHNVKLLDGSDGTFERGNILTWEQRLKDRLAGAPVTMNVKMDATSILHTTLWLFAGAFAAAVLVLVVVIWLVVRRGRKLVRLH
ncbi:MAG TPA: hypothetical protein VFV78_05035 [Vicinamibacterales bacterium]|nr:hypothetical protein [Vicinamibacterales bacterium]